MGVVRESQFHGVAETAGLRDIVDRCCEGIEESLGPQAARRWIIRVDGDGRVRVVVKLETAAGMVRGTAEGADPELALSRAFAGLYGRLVRNSNPSWTERIGPIGPARALPKRR